MFSNGYCEVFITFFSNSIAVNLVYVQYWLHLSTFTFLDPFFCKKITLHGFFLKTLRIGPIAMFKKTQKITVTLKFKILTLK